MKLGELRKASTVAELERILGAQAVYEVGHRGGNLGLRGGDVAEAVGVDADYLPKNYGVYCNYLGGGVRGAVCPSGYDEAIKGRKAQLLDELAEACKRAYIAIEDGDGLNSDYPDGETNWDAEATRRSRQAGVKSAY